MEEESGGHGQFQVDKNKEGVDKSDNSSDESYDDNEEALYYDAVSTNTPLDENSKTDKKEENSLYVNSGDLNTEVVDVLYENSSDLKTKGVDENNENLDENDVVLDENNENLDESFGNKDDNNDDSDKGNEASDEKSDEIDEDIPESDKFKTARTLSWDDVSNYVNTDQTKTQLASNSDKIITESSNEQTGPIDTASLSSKQKNNSVNSTENRFLYPASPFPQIYDKPATKENHISQDFVTRTKGYTNVKKGVVDNSEKVSVKELRRKFNIQDNKQTSSASSYCLAKPLNQFSENYCLAKPIDESAENSVDESGQVNINETLDEGKKENYVQANVVDETKKSYKYKYDPPWNEEFPVVMLPNNEGQNLEQGNQKTSIPSEVKDKVFTDKQPTSEIHTDFEESAKYNFLFEGSVSEEPKMSNIYGNAAFDINEGKLDKASSIPPVSTRLEIHDKPLVPALPIYLSSGTYSNAYEGKLTNSLKSTPSIRSQDNVYEDVSSRTSEGTGWNSSEFDSGSETDYENSPDPDVEMVDKPLPPTPKELARSPQEKAKKKKEKTESGPSSQLLPVTVNLEKHPPPQLPPAPEGLESHQVKRRYAIQSLIDTEKTYIDTLTRLGEEYKEPLLTTFGLKDTPVEIILTKAKEILDIHKMFQIELAEKVQKWDKEEQIGNMFTGFFSREMVIDLYSCYVNNFSVAMEELKTLQNMKTSLASFLTEKAMTSPDRLPIFGLLVKPVQRFPQFITMMQDLLKYTPHQHHDRSSLQTALTDLENVAHKLNESKRVTEQKLQAKKLLKELNLKNFKVEKLLRQDDFDQICELGNIRTKPRRLYLADSHLICTTVTHREQDGRTIERIKHKWAIPLCDLELKDNAISADLSCSVKDSGGLFSIHTKKESIYQESDPLNLQNELEDMVHDYTVIGKISSLVSTLKLSYQNLSEELFLETISDLQRKIQVKKQHLQILNSCTVVVEHTNNFNNRKERYTFQTLSPELKQEWSTDFLLAKLALEPINNPSWTSLTGIDDVTKQPALYMKHLPVDMPRYFTKMKCAVPVYLASHGSSDIGIQHLWVVMTTENRTQVALVSVQNTWPSLVESFQATDCEVIAVEIVPGFATTEKENAFMEDTVWMSTKDKKIVIFSVFNEQGLRDQTKLNRQAKKTFKCPGTANKIHYTIERVFIGTEEGILVIYDRNEEGVWNLESPSIVQLAASSINSIISLDEEVWVACGQHVFIIPVEESCYLEQIEMPCKDGGDISQMVRSGMGLWISHKGSSSIHLYHIETKKHMQEFNVVQSVNNLVQSNPDLSVGQDNSSVITSLMVSKGFLWVGTSCGILLAFPLPRLKDGVPIIGGRPFVSYHGHNKPIQFLIPIYIGTVNLWHKARGLDYNASDLRRQNTGNNERVKVRNVQGSSKKRFSGGDLDKAVSQISLEGDYVKMQQKPKPLAKPNVHSNSDKNVQSITDKEKRLSQSADDILKLFPPESNRLNDRRKTLKLPKKLGAGSHVTKTLGRRVGSGEDDVNEVYRDLMRNESLTNPLKSTSETLPPSVRPIEKSSRPISKQFSFKETFKRATKHRETRGSVRVSTDETRIRALDTLSKRGCNSVMVLMGGDGYIDWRKKLSSSPKNIEAALIIWLYKF